MPPKNQNNSIYQCPESGAKVKFLLLLPVTVVYDNTSTGLTILLAGDVELNPDVCSVGLRFASALEATS